MEVLPLWFSEEAEMKMTVKKDVVATEALMETEEEAPSYQSDAVPLNHDTQAQVLGWCEEYGVPYSVALAVIEAESSFRPDAENGSCYGYMQINSINKSWLFQEIRRIVVGVEAKMGWTFRHKDVCEILQYTEQKARQNGKGQGYVPILFENELRDFVTRSVINAQGRLNECARFADTPTV